MRGKSLFKWGSNMLSSIMILLLVGAVFIVLSSRAAGGEPSLFGYQLKSVLSGSMEPEMPVGSLIAVQLVEKQDSFKNGDVITFRADENILITHRIIEVQDGGKSYLTKGDNNNGPDREPVLAQQIVGQYTGVAIPYLGYVFHYMNTKQGAFLLFVIPGLFFIGHALFTFWRALRFIERLKATTLPNETIKN